MSNAQFKTHLQRDKTFLKDLYKSDSKSKSRKLLTFATDSELLTLIKYTHFVTNGEIHIKKKDFDALGKFIVFLKKNFEKKASFQRIYQMTRMQKLKVLSKFLTHFPHLLAPLFEE